MECPKCRFNNRDGAKFCSGCGHKFELICPQCGNRNLPNSKYCDECGYKISLPPASPSETLSLEEKIGKIQKYLPQGLTRKILAQKERIEGENKQVTVMFCDLKGFTPLVEKLGSEKTYSIMNDIYEILIHKVHEYEGTVNEMTGDGIMALFGAPIAIEDASQRAILASLAIHKEMARFSDKMKRERDDTPPFRMRSGIHTGPVVVGTLGNDLRVEFKAVGDTVNLASRLETLARPGTTYVSEDTFILTEGLFRFEALGEKAVKGKKKPVRIYQVIAPNTRRTRFDVNAERGLTPFVGREREQELLMDGFERVRAGKGQAISIISEAGVGKSRLLYEFRKAIVNEDVTFLEGKCLSYGRGMAYYPFIDLLKSSFNIHMEDDDSKIREKVRTGLNLMNLDEASTLPYCLELLSVAETGLEQISMSPEEKKERIIEALKGIVFKSSGIRSLIMAIEDLHWIDKASEEVLKNIMESIPGFNVFLIFTYRPQFIHSWGGKSYHSQLTLHRLSNRENLSLAAHILGVSEIERPLEELILEKTEGIPFFIEEFIKSLINLTIIEKTENRCGLSKNIQKMKIPLTIQDVIMATVDSLPEPARDLLQTGSVIEREFPYLLLKRVSNLPEQELLSHLSILKDAELLYERGIFPDSTYVFKHALTREVIYDSILTKTKAKHHGEIANAIEELYRDNVREHFEVLSEHFFLGENYLKGAEYSRLASKKAEKRASLNDSITYSKKGITCVEQLPRTEGVERQIIDTRVIHGLYLLQMYRVVEAKQIIEPVITLAKKYNDKKRLGQIYTIMGSYHFFKEENLQTSSTVFKDALQAAGESNDMPTLAFANIWFGSLLCWNCEFEKSDIYLNIGIDISWSANSRWGSAVSKSLLGNFFYYLQGDMNLSFETTTEALDIARESGDIHSKAHSHTNHGMSCYGKGLLDKALKHLIKGADLGKKINLHVWAAYTQLHIGETYFEKGDFIKSKESFKKCIQFLGRDKLLQSFSWLAKAGVAKSMLMNRDGVMDLEILYTFPQKNRLKILEGWIANYISEFLLNLDNPEIIKAEQWILKAIDADKRNNMMFRLGKDYALYATLLKRKGAGQEAKEILVKGIKIFKACGAEGWVEKYEKKLSAFS